jgi:hypothetical protein
MGQCLQAPPRLPPAEIERIVAVDPLFELNLKVYPSRGASRGREMIAVDGDGNVRRCHFAAM